MVRELMFEVITVSQAMDTILDKWRPQLPVEEVPLLSAWGRVLAEDIIAEEDVPHFSRSTMDGYAVAAADTFGAGESLPAYLNLTGEVPMGVAPTMPLETEEAVAVATGSMLPEGADAVVMLERTAKVDEQMIEVHRPVAPGENVIKRGEDVHRGQVVLEKGTAIRAQELGVLASLGVLRIPVYCIRVGIVSTGNELVSPQDTPAPGQIRDSNSYTLFGLVKEAGGMPQLYQLLPDQEEPFRDTILKVAAENQLVLVSGGSSVGTRDLTLKILDELGELLFHGLALAPGKPTLASVLVQPQGDVLVVGLPGHPVSAFVTFKQVVAPLIKLPLKEMLPEALVYGELTKNIPSRPGREEHVRVRLAGEGEKVKVEPVFGKSGMLTTLTAAHGVVTVPLESQGLAAGTKVAVKLFKEL